MIKKLLIAASLCLTIQSANAMEIACTEQSSEKSSSNPLLEIPNPGFDPKLLTVSGQLSVKGLGSHVVVSFFATANGIEIFQSFVDVRLDSNRTPSPFTFARGIPVPHVGPYSLTWDMSALLPIVFRNTQFCLYG